MKSMCIRKNSRSKQREPKIKHLTREDAQEHADFHQSCWPDLEVNIYLCWECGYYHVGRRSKHDFIDKRIEAHNERLAGQFVGFLRQYFSTNYENSTNEDRLHK